MFDAASKRMLEGIGHVLYLAESSPRRGLLAFDTPYPCDSENGQLIGIARAVEPHASVEHVPDACRKSGADRCLYRVTW